MKTAVRGSLVLLAGMIFLLSAAAVVRLQNYRDSDFLTFWLAGWMNWHQQDPYQPEQWIAGHTAFGATWVSDPIFPYPLPLATLLAPLGLLPLEQAYIGYVFLSQIGLCLALYLLLNRSIGAAGKSYFLPLCAGVFLFRPVVVTLRNGQLAVLFLLFVVSAYLLFKNSKWFAGGVLFSFLLLKPTLGLPLLGLVGIWLLRRHRLAALGGFCVGSAGLASLGWLRDPGWVREFLAYGSSKLNTTFGYSPTVWGLADQFCRQDLTCTRWLGSFAALLLAGMIAYYFYIADDKIDIDAALATALPATVLMTPYIWAYDQALLVIPLVVVLGRMVRRGCPFLVAALLPLGVAVLSWTMVFVALRLQRDAWSALLPLVTLFLVLWTGRAGWGKNAPTTSPSALAG